MKSGKSEISGKYVVYHGLALFVMKDSDTSLFVMRFCDVMMIGQRLADKMAAYFFTLEEIVVNLSIVLCSM